MKSPAYSLFISMLIIFNGCAKKDPLPKKEREAPGMLIPLLAATGNGMSYVITAVPSSQSQPPRTQLSRRYEYQGSDSTRPLSLRVGHAGRDFYVETQDSRGYVLSLPDGFSFLGNPEKIDDGWVFATGTSEGAHFRYIIEVQIETP